jgi:acetyl-CoA acetyltransferase
MPGSVIAGGARTPVGKLSGALKNFQAVDLGGLAIKAALEKSGTSGDQVDYVIMGTSSRRGWPVRISHAWPYHPQTCTAQEDSSGSTKP